MSRIGVVQEVQGKYAIISSNRRGICEGCSDQSTCSFDNALGKSVPEIVTVVNPLQAKPGDHVEFDLTGHTELKMSLIVWVVPLIGLMLGAAVGSFYHEPLGVSVDGGTLFGLILGLVVGLSGIIAYEKWVVDKEETLPVLLKIVQQPTCPENPS